ncbi:MAG: RNA-binding protein [Acidobacteriota bacterium]|nr:RNA-binding protein [Acidobacteriota bacterium]
MKNLFIGNLSFQTTESDLRALFAPLGQITRIHIAVERETGRSRGFAFVEMANDDDANRAIATLDGKELAGRNIKVNEARPKTGRPAGQHSGPAGVRGTGTGRRGSFSTEDYGDAARQPREPRW